ncbi:hypothetical protein GQ602_002464 [Ophiocordyceps camponoti-floridani]|uniref:Uncharacterized protein n=1 Tax=Ophiocordyceps camponoti-floridani TaxID=2030778 RepID=A0A8H4VFA9_9HYPO|nr:hypothetical protein GQ602_002464 [Ophiocordyceps camponoti-floridani]
MAATSFGLASHTTSSWLYDCAHVTWTTGLPRPYQMEAFTSHRVSSDPFVVGKKMDWGAYLINILPRDLLYGNKSSNMGQAGRNSIRDSINNESRGDEQRKELRQLVDWIAAQQTAHQRLCWPKHETREILHSYRSTLDGLQNLFVSEVSLRHDSAAKFVRRCPKPVDPSKAYCIDKTSPYYHDITRTIVKFEKKKPGATNTYSSLRIFQHPFLHALAAASRDDYRHCSRNDCARELLYGRSMVPDSFSHFWATVVQAFANQIALCLVFSNTTRMDTDHVYVDGSGRSETISKRRFQSGMSGWL